MGTRLLVAVALALSLVATSVTVAGAARDRTDLEWIAEQVLLGLHNDARQAQGLAPFTEYRDVRDVARAWADHQAGTKKLAHNPNYTSQICCAEGLAENIAMRPIGRTVTDAAVRAAIVAMHNSWMESSGHRRNILGNYQHLGVGMSFARSGNVWYVWSTVNFRRPDASAPGSAIPTPRDIEDTCGKARAPSFTDVPATSVHAATIACIEDAGITSGKGDGTYGAKEFLSRGQIATFLMRTLQAAGHDASTGESCTEGAHRVGMSAMQAWGVFSDADCNQSPQVTRAQMATWTLRALQTAMRRTPPRAEADYFKDDNHLGGDVQGANNAVAAWGIVTGTGNDNFAPSVLLRRDQMATFLARLLDTAKAP